MGKQNRRVMLTVEPGLYSSIAELAEVTNKPVSTCIVGLLGEMQPQLVELAKVARLLKSGNKSAADKALASMLGSAIFETIDGRQVDLFKKGRKS